LELSKGGNKHRISLIGINTKFFKPKWVRPEFFSGPSYISGPNNKGAKPKNLWVKDLNAVLIKKPPHPGATSRESSKIVMKTI